MIRLPGSTCSKCHGTGLVERRVLRMGWKRNRLCSTCKGDGTYPPEYQVQCTSHLQLHLVHMGDGRIRAEDPMDPIFWLEFTVDFKKWKRVDHRGGLPVQGRIRLCPASFESEVRMLPGERHPSFSVKVRPSDHQPIVFLLTPV